MSTQNSATFGPITMDALVKAGVVNGLFPGCRDAFETTVESSGHASYAFGSKVIGKERENGASQLQILRHESWWRTNNLMADETGGEKRG